MTPHHSNGAEGPGKPFRCQQDAVPQCVIGREIAWVRESHSLCQWKYDVGDGCGVVFSAQSLAASLILFERDW